MDRLTTIERAAVAAAGAEPMLEQVEAWATINSGSRNLEGLARMAAIYADAFGVLGSLSFADPDPVQAMTGDGGLQDLPHGRHLHLAVRPAAAVRILFTGHMDTVYGVDHPFQSLHWREPGVLVGPGVADMKGGLAVLLSALKAVEASPLASRVGYEVVINSDEEVGSASSAALITRAARGKRAALTFEPASRPDGTLAGARPGSGNFSIRFTGRSAHAGRNPADGRNAVVAAAALAVRLADSVRPGLLVNVARIEGGGPNNVVPDHAVLRVNIRPQTPAKEQEASVFLREAVDETAAHHDVTCTLHGGFGRPPKTLTSADEALFAMVSAAGADLGQTIAWQPSGGVCDGNNIAACGVPVVDTMGVRGGAIHSPDEYLIVDSLAERAALAAVTILRLAGDAA